MKLESFKEKKNKRKMVYIGIGGIILLLAAIFVYRTYSIYQERQEFDIIKGTVPDQNYDIMFIFYLIDENGNKTISNTIPEGKDYSVTMSCTNGTNGSWDREIWGPVITNLTSTRTKCYITFSGPYQEEILHGTGPVLKEGLIPVTIDNDGVVHKANIFDEWYSYANQKWANAVILEDESVHYEDYEEIPESNIESYFVWIPRYKYQLFNLEEYTSLTKVESKEQTINVIFGTDTTEDSRDGECTTPMLSGETGNCKVGDYMTHPAFLSFGVNGIWVGKFETGYKGATSKSGAQKNEYVENETPDKVQIKPSVYSWTNIQMVKMHLNSYNYKREYDSHMMKSTEWGAVAYLQHSVYGSRANIRINNNSDHITGYAAVREPTTGYTETNISCITTPKACNHYGTASSITVPWNTEIGVKASTTGNITGVYDMSGGAWDILMGVMLDSSGTIPVFASSGFDANTLPEEKYYDKYAYTSSATAFNRRILGDATGEMGPFVAVTYGSMKRQIGSWYKDEGFYFSAAGPWLRGGGVSSLGTGAGVMAFGTCAGIANVGYGFRIVLAL